MKTKKRKFKGYAALDERGFLIWGTLRISPDTAREVFDKYNPSPTDHPRAPKIVPVTILLDEQ